MRRVANCWNHRAAALAAAGALGLGAFGSCSADPGAPGDPPPTEVRRTSSARVLTHHNDNARTGANLAETVLTTSNVNARRFGKLFSRAVDGFIYAQPLYMSNVAVLGRGTHDVVFVATEHNKVYAFDAVDPNASEPLWVADLGPPVPNSFATRDNTSCVDLTPDIGITSTPVIDPRTGLLYVVAATMQPGAPAGFGYQLWALDVTSGHPRQGSPLDIRATAPRVGWRRILGDITFNPGRQLNRPGLLLLNNTVYVAFGGHCDQSNYFGWILGYDAGSLDQVARFVTTPAASTGGGVWQSGQGLAADDAGSIYLMTGNGDFDGDAGGSDLGNSFVRLDATDPSALRVADWFTPHNVADLSSRDIDLGSSGPLLVPGTNLLVGGGKESVLYLLDRGSMGHYRRDDDAQVVQRFRAGVAHIHSAPVFWSGPDGGRLYLWTEEDHLRAFAFDGQRFDPTPVSVDAIPIVHGMPGGALSVSANGSRAGSGIVWASHPFDADGHWNVVHGVLRAFDASDLTRELWDSAQNPARDDAGNFAKFCPPTVADGRVYLATFSNVLNVYGLLDPAATRDR